MDVEKNNEGVIPKDNLAEMYQTAFFLNKKECKINKAELSKLSFQKLKGISNIGMPEGKRKNACKYNGYQKVLIYE